MNEMIMREQSELSTVGKLERMMMELLTIETGTSKKVDDLCIKHDAVAKRVDALENETEVTTQQKNSIRRAVHRQVYSLLDIPYKEKERTEDDKIKKEKYFGAFCRRCYAEVSRMGHLATPYEATKQQYFADVIRDIEGWTPSMGIAPLIDQTDEEARIRLKVKAMGYK